MGIFLKLALVVSISAVWTALFGLVETLPWGLDEVVQILSNTLSVVFTSVPLLETPFQFFMIAIGIQITLTTIHFVMWIISLLR